MIKRMMVKNLLVTLSLVTMLLMIVSPRHVQAQARRSGALFSQPAELKFSPLLRRLFPHFYGKSFPQEELITENLFPIGWSKDGKFAYYTEPGDEACGCYFGKLLITDLVNDKVLWSFDYNGYDDQTDNPKYRAMRDLWRKNRKIFSDKLNQYGIIAQRPFTLLRFPINHAGDQLTATLKIEEEKDEAQRLYSRVKKATLRIASRRGGTKTIYDQAYTEYGPLDLKVLGYLKSPYEPRVAVLMVEVWRGYEGPPHTTQIKVAGASLTTRFK
jgi:hypothetical protein